jgi:protocatechuate 3,4-dioxygenase alpha subunit
MPGRTPSQTVGPYYAIALPWINGGSVTGCAGKRAVITGRVFDGEGKPIPDALVETWQAPVAGSAAAADGKPHGFGRVGTEADGTFRIETRVAESVAPYVDVTVFARGLLKALLTRVYLAPEASVRKDPTLGPLASSPRLATLIARPGPGDEWHWDIRVQGEGETVFFRS